MLRAGRVTPGAYPPGRGSALAGRQEQGWDGDAYAVLEQVEDVIGRVVWWLWAELRDVDEGGLG